MARSVNWRSVNWIIGATAFGIVAGGALLWNGASDDKVEARTDTQVSADPALVDAGPKPAPAVAAEVTAAVPAKETSAVEEAAAMTEESNPDVAKAMQSMTQSLTAGDPRTPELAPRHEREKPAPEVLADPRRYAEYEEAQSRNVAAAYLSALKQIPGLRARIDEAKNAGSQTPEEIAQAEEALAKLVELKQEIEKTHPEMLNAGKKQTGNPQEAPSTEPPT